MSTQTYVIVGGFLIQRDKIQVPVEVGDIVRTCSRLYYFLTDVEKPFVINIVREQNDTISVKDPIIFMPEDKDSTLNRTEGIIAKEIVMQLCLIEAEQEKHLKYTFVNIYGSDIQNIEDLSAIYEKVQPAGMLGEFQASQYLLEDLIRQYNAKRNFGIDDIRVTILTSGDI